MEKVDFAMSRPRILHLMPRTPWPPDDGGRIGLWQFLRATVDDFECATAVFARQGETPDLEPLRRLGVRTHLIRHRHPAVPTALLRGVAGRWPYTITRYWSKATRARVENLAMEMRPDLVMLHHLHLAPYAEAFPDSIVVLRAHNVESVWMSRLAAVADNPLARLYVRHQARRMRDAEAERCAACDLVLAVQESEAAVLRQMQSETQVETIPVSVDLSDFAAPQRSDPPVVLLTGAWGWSPNADGAIRFIEEGWPALRSRIPHARLRLVGKGMTPRLEQTARSAGVEAVGYVQSMREEFASASTMVVPLWVGAGARVKIVEALAARLAVVSTPLGAEGLGLEAGRNVLLADTAKELAAAAAQLLLEPARLEMIAAGGHAIAEARFGRGVVDRRTVALLAEALGRRHAPKAAAG